MKEVEKLIKEAPYAKHIRAWALSLAPTLEQLRGYDAHRIQIIRHKLHQIKNSVPGTEKANLINLVLFVLRRVGTSPRCLFEEKHNHKVTDHAFCAALRRLGVDLSELKDGVRVKAVKAGLIPVRDHQGKIRTFLPPEAA